MSIRSSILALSVLLALSPAQAQSIGGGIDNGGSGGGSGSGTVTSIATGCQATGGTITTSGTISTAETPTTLSGSNPAITTGYCGGLENLSNAGAQTPTIAEAGSSGFGTGWFTDLCNIGGGAQTLTPAAGTVGGASTFVFPAGSAAAPYCIRLVSDGVSNYDVIPFQPGGSSTITAGTTPTSGITSGDFISSTSNLIADSAKAVPSGAVVGTTDSQTLTNKTINGANNTLSNVNLASQVTGVLPQANGGQLATPFLKAGNYYVPYPRVVTTTNNAANNIYFLPATLGVCTIDTITIEIGTGGTGAAFNVGIYADNGSNPQGAALLGQGTPNTSTSTGLITFTLTSSVSITKPGLYWFAAQDGDTTLQWNVPFSTLVSPQGTVNLTDASSLGALFGYQGSGSSGASLPSTAPTTTEIGIGHIPWFAYHCASVP